MQLRVAVLLLASNSSYGLVLNDPYPESDSGKKIYYSSFNEQPKTLDPARSYSSNEYVFIMQIYEPLLQYDYYKRPYELEPLIAASMPQVTYLDKSMQPLPDSLSENVAFSLYRIDIKPGVLYQPHPAFAMDNEGKYRYLPLPDDYLENNDINQLADFKYTGTRELVADDFIYQIKRLADPDVSSPIRELMSEHIVGFREFASQLPPLRTHHYVDLRQYPLSGVKKLNDYSFEILVKGSYSQFLFWLAMPFFAPVPWEVDQFYSQPDMDDKNLSFDWYPVGTGPFMLSENNPNRKMILLKNPNYRQDFFPHSTDPEDVKKGYSINAGKQLPLIDEAYFTLEKESIPRWNKFLQGYYDASAISNENFDQTIRLDTKGEPHLSGEMKARNLQLQQTTDPSIYYLGFNMLDPVVGGNSKRARKLRQAISIAVNYDEFITIFFNGRGQSAQGPIPPGIFGYKEGKAGINPIVYRWDAADNKMLRRDINEARKLMAEAGYPKGRDPSTGKALILHYDSAVTGGPDDKAQLDWMRKQFARIGIDLNIRATQYNRFQEKMRAGNTQIFYWGWNADYPDPENFLFQLYGINGKVRYGGENAANYNNPAYDRLFDQMKNRTNDPKRQELIDKMLAIVREDAPWVWGVNTESLILAQQWANLAKPNTISLGHLKYASIDVALREKLRSLWNQPVLWPIALIVLILSLLILPLLFAYHRKEKSPAKRLHSC
ncbi:ABC transporter substrate-binding protein [Legionella quinlivanii]|uniref:ABC transporter substrate-binding protein n=1 Tax=Legionella quinlivanii TaxID=45073 RepID=UPI000730783D